MNDLFHVIKSGSLSAYADDTQIFMPTKSPRKLKKTINNDLALDYRVDTWYEENGLRRNPAKYQAQNKPQFYCENTRRSPSPTILKY